MPIKYRKPNRGRRASATTLPSPVGGLNGRDSLTDMPANDAFRLDNWFPGSTSVDTRGGSVDFATGLPGAVESLEQYTGAAGSQLFAFSSGGIYDVTFGGVAGAPLRTGMLSNDVTTCMFSNAGAQHLLIYSGADQPLSYNGTVFTPLVITGLTGVQDTLQSAHAFKGRLLLAQKGQLGFYYLAVGAIQGAASYFDLQQQSLKGGYIAAITSFSQESMGSGPQDYAVFATSEGEYIMYGGTDPSSAANWQLVGRYYGPPPIGKRGWFKFRSDVYFITEEGILSFTQIRQMGEEVENEKYITSKLGRNYTDAVLYKGTAGWLGMIYPRGTALMINVPLSGSISGEYVQFVMNTNTNSWCRYTGWNALCWALYGRRTYYGTYDGKIILADEGATDNGAQVQAVARQAWNTFDDERGMGDSDKQFHMATFAMQADGAPVLSCDLNINFEDLQPQYPTPLNIPAGAQWDVEPWDDEYWGGAPNTQSLPVPLGKIGYIGSLWMQAVSTTAKIRWFATRVILEKTRGVLLQ